MSNTTKETKEATAAVDEEECAQTPREIRAASLGQKWAENPAHKHELNRFAEWRAPIRGYEWDLLCRGDSQFYAFAEGVIETMMPGMATPELAWECWCDWLQLESAEETQPEEVRAFLDAAFECWEKEDMTNW